MSKAVIFALISELKEALERAISAECLVTERVTENEDLKERLETAYEKVEYLEATLAQREIALKALNVEFMDAVRQNNEMRGRLSRSNLVWNDEVESYVSPIEPKFNGVNEQTGVPTYEDVKDELNSVKDTMEGYTKER